MKEATPEHNTGQAAPVLIMRGDRGSLVGRQIAVSALPFTMGRHADNNLVLPETQVSRHHARLELVAGRWLLRDLSSANGTFVNRQQLGTNQAVPLNDGDSIGLGESVFTVTLVAGRDAPPQPGAVRAAARARPASPLAVIVVAVALVAVIVMVVWLLAERVEQEEATPPALALPTVVLPEIEVPTVQLPALSLPALEAPTVPPVPTTAADLIAPLKTALPALKLPEGLPTP